MQARSVPGSTGMFTFIKSYELAHCTDGSSNTIAFSEALTGDGKGEASPVDGLRWDPASHRLTSRRKGDGFRQWYRAGLGDGILVGRFSHRNDSPGEPDSPEAFGSQVAGWKGEVIDREIVLRVYELLINHRYRARIRIDQGPAADLPFISRLKVYSTTDGGARGEEAEHDLQVTHWDGRDLRFIRRGPGLTQEYAGLVQCRRIEGTFRRSRPNEDIPWHGERAAVLGYGLSPRTPRDRLAWRERTRRQLFRLMMAVNPEPLSRTVSTPKAPGESTDDRPVIASTKFPPHRDDDPDSWPQAYRLRELQFDYILPNPYGGRPIERRSHGHLALPTAPPPASGKYPAVLAVNGHGGSARQFMNPGSAPFWLGDAFARRGYVILALDISHRPLEDCRGLYEGPDNGDDPAHGKPAHPSIKPDGMDSVWGEDGERAWDSRRATNFLLSLPIVDPDLLHVTGISMGGGGHVLHRRPQHPVRPQPPLRVFARHGRLEVPGEPRLLGREQR